MRELTLHERHQVYKLALQYLEGEEIPSTSIAYSDTKHWAMQRSGLCELCSYAAVALGFMPRENLIQAFNGGTYILGQLPEFVSHEPKVHATSLFWWAIDDRQVRRDVLIDCITRTATSLVTT